MTYDQVIAKLGELSAQCVTKPDNDFAKMGEALQYHRQEMYEGHRLVTDAIQMLCQGAKLKNLSGTAQSSITVQDVAKLKAERDACLAVCKTVLKYFGQYRPVDLFQSTTFREALYAATNGRCSQQHGSDHD
jgi:hypothetical protein